MITFIGATSFSGSTMLDVILGHGEDCFACGEPYALFRPKPWRPHQYQFNCACNDQNCRIWQEAKSKGPNQLYEYLYSLGYNYISDSSKNIAWFMQQSKIIQKKNYTYNKVLIYKHPAEYLFSHYKRKKIMFLQRYKWYRYYSNFLKKLREPIIVSYKDLAIKPEKTIKSLCKELEIPYYDNKTKFWEGVSHHILGASSVRMQYMEKDAEKYRQILKERNNEVGDTSALQKRHHKISYNDDWKYKLPSKYKKLFPRVETLYRQLESQKLQI